MAMHSNETSAKVIEYKVDLAKPFIGEVPAGKLVKEFFGRDAVAKANELRDKLNDKESARMLKGNGNEIKGYYVKGNLAVQVSQPDV